MNAITTFPHAQLLLTSSITILQREQVITWSTFYQWMESLCWRRMVKREQAGHLDTLVLCGVVRIVKHARTQKVSVQRRSLSLDAQGAPVWSWVRTTYVPSFGMQALGDSLAWRFRKVLEFAIEALFEDLKKQGISQLNTPVTAKKLRYQYDDIDTQRVKRAFLPLDNHTQSWVCERFSNQFGVLEDGIKQGGRALYKHLWDFVDKEALSLYLQIYQRSLSETTLKDVMILQRAISDKTIFQANRVWLPWLSVFYGDKKNHFREPNLFSYDYLLTHLPDGVTKNAIRKINRQSRRVQVLLIDGRMWTTAELSLVDALQGYPVSIQVRILTTVKEEKEGGYFQERHRDDASSQAHAFRLYQRVVLRWAQYFRTMVGQVKVRKQSEQWRRALRQFDDIFDWVVREDVAVHKNQTWYSLVQQHDCWIAELNAHRQAQDAEQDETTWQAAKWTPFDAQGITIEEITLGKRLREEGQEMEHCVFSYLWDCSQQRYRVFSLRSESERATLGLYIDPVTHRCRYDQLRSRGNGEVETVLERVANQLIKQINANVVKN
ncbi:PcfJ domain-containing protein [Vibrio parahaemolyticus]|uniref:PcfJ domain-containing protein n=1 Tax=Vibrio parahaemolyticus TaxID=670 RepID=UPI001E6284B9|nr:PcfJ domain-containing protein [Vibrio parahaemolyticus]MCD1416877.1 PcfJ domain-containing protein [Vibrio parahaemolyticus]